MGRGCTQQTVGTEDGVGVAEGCTPALVLSERGWSERGCAGKPTVVM